MNTLEDRLRAALTAKSDAVAFSMLTRSLPALEAEPDAAPVIPLPSNQQHRPHRSRRLVAVALATAAVLLVAFGAVALHRATTADRFGPAHVRPRSAIPWNQVGPGWTLVQDTPKVVLNGLHLAGVEQLQLVDPNEHRYQIASLAAGWYLVTWDGQHRHALLRGGYAGIDLNLKTEEDYLMVVDLVDGTQHTFAAPLYARTPLFDGDDGQYITYVGGVQVVRYSLTGQPRHPRSPIPTSELVADSPDGKQAIVDGHTGLDVYDYASGQRVGSLSPPAGYAGCYDPQWGNDGKLIATCMQTGNRKKIGTFVFSAGGQLAAGRADPAYDHGTSLRITGFREGTVSTYYPDDSKNPTPDSFPSLTHLTATRLDATGHTVPIPVPVQIRNSQWTIVGSTPDTFTVVRYKPSDSSLYTAVASWNPFTGQLTELIHTATPTEALISVLPWGSQEY